jgi:hypothetical protein
MGDWAVSSSISTRPRSGTSIPNLERPKAVLVNCPAAARPTNFEWLSAKEDVPNPIAGATPLKIVGQARPGLHGSELALLEHAREPRLRRAARRGDHRGPAGVQYPPIGAGRHPLRPARCAAQRHRPVAAGDHRAQQGQQAPDREDRPRHGPGPGLVPSCPVLHPKRIRRSCGSARAAGDR